MEAQMAGGNSRAINLILAKTAHFVIVLIASLILRRNRATLSVKQVSPLLPCLILTMYICILFYRIIPDIDNDLSIPLVIALIGLLYINVIIIINTQSIKTNIIDIEEQKLAVHNYEMQKKYYLSAIKDRDETRALWHDIKKHVIALEALMDSHDIISAKKEYEYLRHSCDELGMLVDIENTTLNAILHHNIIRAKLSDIPVNLDAQVSPELDISAVDLSVIIGNTFDNAIEECVTLGDVPKSIDVTIIQKNHLLLYEICNPCLLISHKKTGAFHGYGLRNVKRCIDKYGGSMENGIIDGQYRVSIRLNC